MPCSGVCISHSTGAGGEEVGRLVAERLGFLYVDEEIVAAAATRGGIDPGDVADVRQPSRPHGTAYNDFERPDRSRYRLRPHRATESDYQDERLDHGA